MVKNLDGKDQISLQQMEWNKKMIGHLEDQSGLKAVEKECKNVKENVGILDMTAFAKCRIKGPKAETFLDYLVANKLPKKIGRINLCHALNTKGGVHSEFTIMREAEDSFYLVSAGAFQRLDHDWILKWMPKDGSVQFESFNK